jgi:hypothetical protein
MFWAIVGLFRVPAGAESGYLRVAGGAQTPAAVYFDSKRKWWLVNEFNMELI